MDVVELTSHVYFLRMPVGHIYLCRDDDGLTLVDSRGIRRVRARDRQAIRGLGHEPSDVRRPVLTHFHHDHVGAAAEVAAWGDVEVLAHRADAPVIRGEADGPPPLLLDWERPSSSSRPRRCPRTRPVRVDRELEDGDVIGPGSRAVAAPGRTPAAWRCSGRRRASCSPETRSRAPRTGGSS